MKASSQREGIQVSSSSQFLGPVSEVHDVFSSRNVPSTSGVNEGHVFTISWITQTKNLKDDFLGLAGGGVASN